MKKMKKLVIIILYMVCIVSVMYYISIKYKEYEGEKKIEELRKYTERFEKEKTTSNEKKENLHVVDSTSNETVIESKDSKILPEYLALYSENSDLYGWLKIEGTVIDYPVMYTTQENSQFYLHRDWNKQESKEGLLFADERTTDETENVIIYGHCMKNRTMFGSLKDYKNIEFYEKHKYIEFNTLYEKSTYEIVSISKGIVYYTEEPQDEYLYYYHTELDTVDEFDAYIKNAKDNAYFETGVTAKYGDKLITLSTCDYWTENARLYIVAKKIS